MNEITFKAENELFSFWPKSESVSFFVCPQTSTYAEIAGIAGNGRDMSCTKNLGLRGSMSEMFNENVYDSVSSLQLSKTFNPRRVAVTKNLVDQ